MITIIGKNESGKSNILKGATLLDSSNESTSDDIPEPLPDEDEVNDSYVRFVFELEAIEVEEILNNVIELIEGYDEDEVFILHLNKPLTLSEFCSKKNSGTYRIDIKENSRGPRYWTINSYAFKPSNFVYNLKDINDNPQNITKSLIYRSSIEDEFLDKYEISTSTKLMQVVGDEIRKVITDNLPSIINWKYDNSQLLPASVKISDFIANSYAIMPLHNIFSIAGITNISESITTAQEGGKTKLPNLLKRVSQKVTEFLKSSWESYDNIKISIEQNGDNLDCNIEEENKFTFEQRSDGFKRFISFLLNISTSTISSKYTNTILVLDEPDLGLHPSAVRDLRNELIKLSLTSNIIVSTHSIFLIDQTCLDRHRIIEKIDEKTSVSIPQSHSLSDEELIYRAVGYSLYEIIKAKNIVFEGWRDKKLYQVAITKQKHGYKAVFEKLNSVGICHCTGVKQIQNFTPTFEIAQRDCLIISDNDSMAKQYQRKYSENKGFGEWYTYRDIDPNCLAITGEDFIKTSKLKSAIVEFKKENSTFQGTPKYVSLKGFMDEFEKWCIKNNIKDKGEISDFKRKYKEILFDTLLQEDIKKEYFEFLKKVADKI